MNIAFYLHRGIYGGGERILLTLMSEFDKRGHSVFIYTPNKEVPLQITKFHVIVIKGNKLLQILEITKSFKRHHIDVVYVFGTMTHYFVASKLSGVKFIQSLRIDPLQIDNKKFGNWLVYNFSDAHVFQTKKVLNFYNSRIKKRSTVIPNPIMDDLPDPAVQREKKIAIVGRLSEEKNQAMAISAFSKIKSNGYTLHLFGQGPKEQELRALVKSLGLEQKVIFEGQVKRIVNHIQSFDILLLTSNFEGMPNALIEGMAMGVACISTNFPTGAAVELIEDGKSGFVVPMNDADTLAERLQTLIDNDNLRKHIQSEAVKIREKLKKDKIINLWIEYTKKVTNK